MIEFLLNVLIAWTATVLLLGVPLGSIYLYSEGYRLKDIKMVGKFVRATFTPAVPLDIEVARNLLDQRTRMQTSVLPNTNERSVLRMHALSRIVLITSVLLESLSFSLDRFGLRKSLLRRVMSRLWVSPTQLFEFFITSSVLGMAKSAFTEEPRLRILTRPQSQTGDAAAWLMNAINVVLGPTKSAGNAAAFESICPVYIGELLLMSQSDATMFQPAVRPEHKRRRAFWAMLAPESMSPTPAHFIENFRKATHTLLLSELRLPQVLADNLSVDPHVLFFTGFLLFVKRELDTMPVYKSTALFIRSNRHLARSYASFYASAHKASLHPEQQWNVIANACGNFLREIFVAVGRIETMPLTTKISRHFLRDYDDCASLEDDQSWEYLRINGPFTPPQDSQFSPLQVCFCQSNNRMIWDMSRIISNSNVRLLSRTVAWVVVTVPPASVDRILGIARSGVIFASLLALILEKPISIVDLDTSFNIDPAPSLLERLLLVDDCLQSGYSLLFTRLMLHRKRIPDENVHVISIAQYNPDSGSYSDVTLPYIDGSHRWRRSIPHALTYSYREPNGPQVFPRIDSDITASVPEWVIEHLSSRIRRLLAKVHRLSKPQLSAIIWRFCRSGEFLKANLLYDHPKTVLAIARHFLDLALSRDINMIVAASTAATPVVAGMALIAMHEHGDRDIQMLIFPRDRTSILRLEEMSPAQRSATKCAVVDVSFRSGQRYAYVRDVLERYGIVPQLAVSLIDAAYWGKKENISAETYSICKIGTHSSG